MNAKFIVAALLTIAVFPLSGNIKASDHSLYEGFVKPDNASRPRVWWHWMDGNITKEGIKADLEWMNRVGIGGFHNFDAGINTPQVVKNRLIYMTPEWKDAFLFTTKLADSLKLEMAIAGSPGWSLMGGPWVPAKDGMKKIVWSEVRVKGGQPFTGILPKPPTVSGEFQNLSLNEESGSSSGKQKVIPTYFEDIAVLAYRLPTADVPLSELAPQISSSGGNFSLAQLTDGDLETTNFLPKDTKNGFAWIQYEFPQPQTIKAVTVVGGGTRIVTGIPGPSKERSLEVSDDGVTFRFIAYIPLSTLAQQTISFAPVTARYFRVTFKNPKAPFSFMAMLSGVRAEPIPGTNIAELVLHPISRINHFEEKTGFAVAPNLAQLPTNSTTDVTAITDVVDLTDKMASNGKLNWTPPTGNWKIVRFGYSLTGRENSPATPEATGLEVDKLDPFALKNYFEHYLRNYKNATAGLMGKKGLQYMIIDSYESGQENWTPKMAEEFKRRRGYSLLPWMPVFTGTIIKSAEESDKFLWDFRQTIAELVAENYDQLSNILNKYGMKRYTESHESGRTHVADGMDTKRKAAIPMSAMWAIGDPVIGQSDIRESASVAHLYGQNLVAAESFTVAGFGGAAWAYYPEKLKPTADLELASGLNRFVIHTSVHQPVFDKIPGLSTGIYGQWFTRNETWAEQAKAWTDYLSRSSYMLQQGKFVADVLYYYGEDNNIVSLFGLKLPNVPEEFSYDFINPYALINLMKVQDGKLITATGMSYRVLHLDDNARQMSLPVPRKIAELVKEGATISGIKPESTPSLKDNKQEFQQLVSEIWETGNPRVYTGKSVKEVLSALNIELDFEYIKTQKKTQLLYVHRKLPKGDIYWVNNRNDSYETVEATFRVSGMEPEIWHPETGVREAASYSIVNGRTRVTLNLTPNDAVFVVFMNTTSNNMLTLPKRIEKEITTLSGAWNVAFQPNRGAPESAVFDSLVSYTKNNNPGIKYFSGTATYKKTVNITIPELSKGTQLWLDLGDVKNLAEVIVNGKSLGVVWKQPFRVNVTNTVKTGVNNLEIKLINLWVNRLIGDKQPDVTQKITYTTLPFYKADSSLKPSGLSGPVKLISLEK